MLRTSLKFPWNVNKIPFSFVYTFKENLIIDWHTTIEPLNRRPKTREKKR